MGDSVNPKNRPFDFDPATTIEKGRAGKLGPGANWYDDPAGALFGALGFGPGPSWTPQQEAAEQAQARQARIQSAVNRINDIFASPERQQQYSDLGQATTQHYVDELNRRRDKATDRLKFALAGRGQTGGSEAANLNQQAAEDYQKGLLRAGTRGQEAAQQLRAKDQRARQNLLSLAQAGLSSGQAAQEAGQSLLANLNRARTQSTAQDLGNIFGNLGQTYERAQNYAQQRALQNQALRYLYSLGYNPNQFGGY